MTASEGASSHPPLHGIQVVDLTTFLSGPFCTQILGDLGADVIKLEPPDGDSSRHIPPHFVGDDSAYYLANNRNKRSVIVDLKTAAGRSVARRLVVASDVVVENFRPGVARRLGLDPDEIQHDWPDLVWASISGFGQDGPRRDQPAYDMIVQALSGVMSLTGEPGRPPVRLGIPAGDLVAGMYAVIGILAALLGRHASGSGSRLDIAMLDCQLAMLSYQAAYATIGGVTPGAQGSGHDSIPTYRMFQTKDGRRLAVTAVTPRMWRSLCTILALDLVEDERFATGAARLENAEQLWPLLESAFLREPAVTWVTRLSAAGVPAAVVKSVPEALDDAERSGRGMVVPLRDRNGERARVVGNPIVIRGQRSVSPAYPPALGEHTVSVLATKLEMPTEEIDGLRRRGAFGPQAGLQEPSGNERAEAVPPGHGLSPSRAGGVVLLDAEHHGSGAETLLLLHPVGLDRHAWDDVASRLAAHHRVVAPSLRGHGTSPAEPGPWTMQDLAADVHRLLNGGDYGPVHVIGMSMGGMVAQQLALDHPDDVASLVLIATAAGFDADTRATLRTRGRQALDGGMATVVDETLARWVTTHDRSDAVLGYLRRRLLDDDPRAWAHSWQAIADFDIRQRLGEIDRPALVLGGTADASITPAVSAALAAALPAATLQIVTDAAHLAPLERPAQYATLITEFVRTTCQSS